MLFTVFIYIQRKHYILQICDARKIIIYWQSGEKNVSRCTFAGLPPWLRDRMPIDLSSFSLHLAFLNFPFDFCFFLFPCYLRARARATCLTARNGSISMLKHPSVVAKKKEKLIIVFSFRLWLMTRIVFFKHLLRHEYSCSRIYPAGNWLGNADGRNFYETREI